MSTITGNSDNNTLIGTSADDVFQGLAGVDTAVIGSLSSNASFSLDAQGRWVVSSSAGQDTLSGMELVQFTDGLVRLGEDETRVNTQGASHQFKNYPAITTLNDGGYVVTWMSYLQDGSGQGIYAQRYTADGAALGSETRINTTIANDQSNPAISGLSDDGYVVTWMSSSQDGSGFGIYAQRYAANGTAVGSESRVNTTVVGDQDSPAIATLSGGGYVVTWMSLGQDGSDWGVYAQRYAGDGTAAGSETRVNTTVTNAQFLPAIAALSGGGYVVTWVSFGQDAPLSHGIYAQSYAADGTAMGSETRVNTTVAAPQEGATIAALSGGGYVITWMSLGQDGSGYGIYAQRYAADGTALGSETRINTTVAGEQWYPAITGLSGGGYVITWKSLGQDGSGWGVYAQRYAPDGTAAGSETRINTTVVGNQDDQAITALSDGGYVVTWQSDGQDGGGNGIYAQRYAADGTAIGSGTALQGDAGNNVLKFGSAVPVHLLGMAGDDTLQGGGAGDIFDGGDGSDTVRSPDPLSAITWSIDAAGRISITGPQSGTDELISVEKVQAEDGTVAVRLDFLDHLELVGDAQANTLRVNPNVNTDVELYGGAGDDTLAAGAGNDHLYGGAGDDALAGGAGDDDLYGDVGDDTLVGGAGIDDLNGGEGGDAMFGGGGDDFYVVDNRRDAVTELTDEGIDTVLASITYKLDPNVEELYLNGSAPINGTGNSLDNVLRGNNADNKLDGGAGNDVIAGFGGNDTLIGGLGSDQLDGGGGLDIFRINTQLGATNVDTIENFVTADDVIELDRGVFTALKGKGVLAANAFVSGTAALDANDRIIYNDSTGALLYDADGTGAVAAVQFATLVGVVGTLSAADFVVT